jgi:hypothetical protein
MDGAQDSSWRCHCFNQLYFAAMPSYMVIDVDGLACYLHHPTVCDCHTRGQSFLSGAALSHRVPVGDDAFFGG